MIMFFSRCVRQSAQWVVVCALLCTLVLLPYAPARAFTNDSNPFDVVAAIVVHVIVQGWTQTGEVLDTQTTSRATYDGNLIIVQMLFALMHNLKDRYAKQWNGIEKILQDHKQCFVLKSTKTNKRAFGKEKSGNKANKSNTKPCMVVVMNKVVNVLRSTDVLPWLETQLSANDQLRYTLYETACNSFMIVSMGKSNQCRNTILVKRAPTLRSGSGVSASGGVVSKSVCAVRVKTDKVSVENCVDSVYNNIRNQFPMSWRDKCEAQVNAYRSSGQIALADMLWNKCFPPAPVEEVDRGALTFTDTETANMWGSRAFSAWYAGLRDQEKEAIEQYTASEYGPLNQCLRKKNCTEEQWKHIAKIKDALTKAVMPNTIVVHRTGDHGILREQSQDAKSDQTMRTIIGKTFTTPGFMSTGLVAGRSGVAQSRNVEVEIVLTIPAKTRGCAYVGMISEKPEEAEVLCDHGKKAIIMEVKKVKGRLIVYANML